MPSECDSAAGRDLPAGDFDPLQPPIQGTQHGNLVLYQRAVRERRGRIRRNQRLLGREQIEIAQGAHT